MKILMLSLDRGLCRPDSPVYRRLLNYAREAELRVIVFTTSEFQSEIHDGNLHIYPTGSRVRALYFLDFWRLASRFLASDKDRQFVITAQDPFEVGLVGYVLAWFYNRPLQIQVHIDFFSRYFQKESWRQWGQAKLARLILPRADAVRVVSARLYDYLTKVMKLPAGRVTELPVFTDVSHYLSAPIVVDLHRKYPQYEKIILLAARFVPQKNIPLAIKSFARVVESFPKAGLVIVGRGPEEKHLRSLAKDIPNISFESWADDLASYYQTTDVFLLSSDYEGWGLTAVEAGASGVPVVMTEVGCAGEFVISGQSGLVVPVDDESRLTAALMEILSNPTRAKELGAQAKIRAQMLPTEQDNVKAMLVGWQNISLRPRSKVFSPEVFKFVITGTISSLAALFTIFIAVDGVGLKPVPGSVVANIASGTTGFLLNKHWTFSNKSNQWHRQAVFYGCLVVGNVAAAAFLMHILNSILHIWYLLAQVLIILIMMSINFLFNRFVIFRREKI